MKRSIKWISVVTGLLGIGALIWFLGKATPIAPVAVAWDRAACAHCRMHVGDPAFAVQARAADGTVYTFDDPGCFFAFEQAEHPELIAIFFHHVRDPERWITREEVGFVSVPSSPMHYQLGAVTQSEKPTFTLAAARDQALAPKGAEH